MGNTFEVYSNRGAPLGELTQVYAGESRADALRFMLDEKEKGAGYVKLEWR